MLVTEYDVIEDYLDMFFERECDLLVLKGRPGTGKTYSTRTRADENSAAYLNTYMTPLAAYNLLYEYKDVPIVVDDIDTLMDSKRLRSLLKSAGDTYSSKTLSWNSTSQKVEAPQEFETTSNICLVLNEFRQNNLNEKALADRGFVLDFWPTDDELLNRMETVTRLYDQNGLTEEQRFEVFRYIKERMTYEESMETLEGKPCGAANLRTLVKGFQAKQWSLKKGSGDDWQDKVNQIIGFDVRLKLVDDLLQKHSTVKDAFHEYREVMENRGLEGGSRSTFYRLKDRLE